MPPVGHLERMRLSLPSINNALRECERGERGAIDCQGPPFPWKHRPLTNRAASHTVCVAWPHNKWLGKILLIRLRCVSCGFCNSINFFLKGEKTTTTMNRQELYPLLGFTYQMGPLSDDFCSDEWPQSVFAFAYQWTASPSQTCALFLHDPHETKLFKAVLQVDAALFRLDASYSISSQVLRGSERDEGGVHLRVTMKLGTRVTSQPLLLVQNSLLCK